MCATLSGKFPPIPKVINAGEHVLDPCFTFSFQLEILTSLATETNISIILRELQVCTWL